MKRAAFDPKRAVDLLAAGCLLVVGTPICLLVALAIKLEDGGPVLFRQTRVGRNGALFTLRKLRSMRPDAEAESGPQWAAVNDPRVTRVGRWIRALRIDEIPQAWNVLMRRDVVRRPAPRTPGVRRHAARDAFPHYEYRHNVRPGITGWAQVNQPLHGIVEHAGIKQQYDLYYLEHLSAAARRR